MSRFITPRNIIIAVALIAVVWGVAYWRAANNAPTAGEVTDKSHKGAWVQVIPGHWVSNGKGGGYMTPTQTIHHPESWSVQVTGEQKDGDIGTWWYGVSSGKFALITIGDWYDSETGEIVKIVDRLRE